MLGLLYGFNTLGAVAGTLLTEGYLVRVCGLFGTGLVAGFISIIAAASAWVIARNAGAARNSSPGEPIARVSRVDRPLPWRLLFISLLTGMIILCLEVVWFRLLHLYVASTATAFSVMLAIVFAGIGLGGISAGAVPPRMARSSGFLPALLLSSAGTTLISYWLYPASTAHGNNLLHNLDSWKQIAWLAFSLTFPVAFLSGMLLPSIAARVQESVGNRTKSTGLTTLFNTAGAAIGPLLASFLFLPAIGFQWTLIVCAVSYALLAVLVNYRAAWAVRRRGWVTASLLGLGAIFAFIVVCFPYRDNTHFASARRPYEVDGSRLVRKVESSADTLQLLRRDLFGQPYYYRLVTNGFSMSGTAPSNQRYMRLFAYLPLALRPESQDVLQLCYGVGVTADAFVHDHRLKRIDIVDTSHEVFDLAIDSGRGYPDPLRDPRVRTFIQDGRFFLQASPRKYDIITGEPPPLKVAGTVNLYTKEFFSLMRSQLKQGGMASFWLPIYQLKVEETKLILAAFHAAFPNASVWGSSDDEWIMLGINGAGPALSSKEVGYLWRDPSMREDLISVGMEIPEQLAALFLMDGAEIDRITQGVKPLSDWYPKLLSDVAPDPKITQQFAYPYIEASSAFREFRTSALIAKIWPEPNSDALMASFLVREMRYRSRLSGSNWLAELDFYLRHSSLRTPILEVLKSDEFRVAIAERSIQKSEPAIAQALPDLVAGALARRDLTRAITLLESEQDQRFDNLNHFFLLTYLYCLNGKVEKAETLAAAHAALIQEDWFVHWLWGDLQAEFGFRPPRS